MIVSHSCVYLVSGAEFRRRIRVKIRKKQRGQTGSPSIGGGETSSGNAEGAQRRGLHVGGVRRAGGDHFEPPPRR